MSILIGVVAVVESRSEHVIDISPHHRSWLSSSRATFLEFKQPLIWFIPGGGGGGTQMLFGRGCEAEASKPVPIFKGHFGRKGTHY